MYRPLWLQAASILLLTGATVRAAAVFVPETEPQSRPRAFGLKNAGVVSLSQSPALSGPAAPMSADGSGTVAGAPPGTQVYRNVIGGGLLIYRPGAGQRMADDLTLASGTCTATYYSLRVAGLNQGGGETFDVQAALWDGDPCIPGSTIITGTESSFTGIPNNLSVFDLEVTLDPMVPVPGTVWLAATFSTNDSGWIRADRAEVGSTANIWSENHVQQVPEDDPTGCGLFLFDTSGTDWAGFWAQVRCTIPGNPIGACCNGSACTQTTQANCGGGLWQGAFTSCVPNVCLSGACCTGGVFATCAETTEDQCLAGLFHPGGICAEGACGPNFRVYENTFDTGIFDIIAPGTKWGDDLLLGSGAPCGLSSYEVLFVGDRDASTNPFNVHTELWTNNDRGTPTADGDDIPGALIAGTQADFQNVTSDFVSQRLLAGPFPGISLPKKVWVVMTTNVAYAGPVTAGPASFGYSVDGFAIFNAPGGSGVWTPGFWYDGFDPTGCPGLACTPAGSFRVKVWCEGTPPTGACCNAASGTCTEDVRELDCEGRWREGMPCGPDTFEPVCGAAACCYPQFVPPNPDPIMQCLNVTLEECQGLEGALKQGRFCNEVECPMYQCLGRTGDCFAAHAEGGCQDAYCCDVVCDSLTGDPFCCTTEWDATCAMDALNRCERPVENDHCANAKPIALTGTFDFDNSRATTDGPLHLACETEGGDAQIIKDVWYCWTAPCTTQVLARTCGQTQVDTKIAVYEGCTCPPTDAALLDCDDDRCDLQSMAAFDAVAGNQYLIRVGSYPGKPGGAGSLTLTCGPIPNAACPATTGDCCTGHGPGTACSDKTCCETVCTCDPYCCNTEWDDACATHGFAGNGCGAAELCTDVCASPCLSGGVSWVNPPSGMVDARLPHQANSPTSLLGVKTFSVQAPAGSDRVECWMLCETAIAGNPNTVESVTDEGRGRFTVTLARPITPGAATTLTYKGSGASATFISHPSNVNSDSAAAPSDILELIDNLNGVRMCPGTQTVCPLAMWQCDIDRSNVCAPADILSEIDLLNGANGFQVWNGTSKPAAAGICP